MKNRLRPFLVSALARGLPHLLLSNAAQQAVAFLTVLIVARFLAPDEFAMVRIAMAYVAIAAVVAGAGLTAPVLRYCADPDFGTTERRFLLGSALRRLVGISVATMAIALALIAGGGRGETETLVFSTYALQLPGLAAATLFLVYLQAIQQFRRLAAYQLAIRLLALLVTGGSAYLWGLPGLLAAALAVAYLSCAPLWLATRPALRGAMQLPLPNDFYRLARYSAVGTLITAVGQYADLLMLDLSGADRPSVAVYSLASIFFFSAIGVAGAAQGIATPAFTELMVRPDLFRRQLVRWSIMLSLASVPIAVSITAFSWLVENYLLAGKYEDLSLVLALLMVKFCLWCSYAISGAALVGIGAIRQGTWIASATTVFAIVAGYPLCMLYGIWGAAAVQIATALLTAVLVFRVTQAQLSCLAAGQDHAAQGGKQELASRVK